MGRLTAMVGLALAICLVGGRQTRAQQIRGVVSDSGVAGPIAGAVVSLVDSSGAVTGRTITDGAGRFALADRPRSARLRVIRIGFQPRDVALSPPLDATMQIAMARLPTTLATMRVSGRELCPGSDDRGPAFQVWEQARAGLLATVVARESNPARATSMTFKQLFDPGNDLVKHIETKVVSGATTRPFVASASAAEFARNGYMSEDATGRTYYAPDADVLLDESFAATHCFHLVPDEAKHAGQIGLAFAPAPASSRDTLVDVRGVIWIDRATPALRSLDFLYTALERPAMNWNAGGHLEFFTAANGIAFVERWVLRLVTMEVYRAPASAAQRNVFIGHRREDRNDPRAVGIDETGGQVLAAGWPDGTAWRAPETGITGHVVQTAAAAPVAHAAVTLTGGADTVDTDSTGAFAIPHMVPGRYEIVAADTTIGAHVPPRRVVQVVDVPRDRTVDVRLKVAPLTDLLADLCKDQRRRKNTSAILGRLSIADGPRLQDAKVIAKWQADFERVSGDGPPVGVTVETQESKIDENGRFLVCGVALDRPIQLRLTAHEGTLADTTVYARRETFNAMEWRVIRR